MADPLKKKFQEKALALFTEMRALLKEHGDLKVDEVKLRQVLGGARGIKMMLWETSQLDAIEGIRFRGYSIPQLQEKLPLINGSKEPLPESLFWLMLVGEIPTAEEIEWLSKEWSKRSEVPQQTFDVLDTLPKDTHPMTQFSLAIVSMQSESVFASRYDEGMNKKEYWDATYEDAMNLIARLPKVAAYIYRRTYHDGKHIEANPELDWAANFAHMLGIEGDDFQNLMRLYLTIHADHEGGNASAHTVHLVNSTLSDPYLSFASGMNALAGPLHGLANQEVIKWIFKMVDALGTTKPTKEQIAQYVHDTLDAGQVIPGYGHAVLRQPDPRFTAQKGFAERYIKDDDIVNVVWKIFDVVPPILDSLGKVKNPWPNVDAHSGALLVHYGLKEYGYYTVLFGVSRALGVLAALCWSRALGMPLERPKSVTSEWVKTYLAEQGVTA
ncbi:MAG: citrate (Si)-synthase [Bacteroidota bacterium]